MPAVPARILTVYAHPDDESFGPAAILAHYAREGAAVNGLFATRGEHGQAVPELDVSPEELGRLREQDLYDATAAIGYRRVHLLGYEDGTLADVDPAELRGHVLVALLAHRPDTVFTFGPGGITRHPDHLAIHRATTDAFHQARDQGLDVRELYYDALGPEKAAELGVADLPDGQPNTWVDVRDTFDVKLEALRIHGRHVLDAREHAEKLTNEGPREREPLHRAWPPAG